MAEFAFLLSNLYAMKRMFPTTLTLVNRGEQALNVDSGEVTETEGRVTIRRAVLFPERKGTYLSTAEKEALFLADRYVLVDYRDIPASFSVDKSTRVEHGGVWWTIVDMADFQQNALRLGLKRVTGDVSPSTPATAHTGPFDDDGDPLA